MGTSEQFADRVGVECCSTKKEDWMRRQAAHNVGIHGLGKSEQSSDWVRVGDCVTCKTCANLRMWVPLWRSGRSALARVCLVKSASSDIAVLRGRVLGLLALRLPTRGGSCTLQTLPWCRHTVACHTTLDDAVDGVQRVLPVELYVCMGSSGQQSGCCSSTAALNAGDSTLSFLLCGCLRVGWAVRAATGP